MICFNTLSICIIQHHLASVEAVSAPSLIFLLQAAKWPETTNRANSYLIVLTTRSDFCRSVKMMQHLITGNYWIVRNHEDLT
ncbi:hypothetical protein T4E_1904 [Trichinella pseudospiralis]|uniref:Secreted protein n=1 Tax=Trichinella pseudospiralis TaxID=6337 RepID=A0A0V0XSQ9_TRIPS|nr:hypothetical protein T4E_1904 [Trichinella pseudospiralis]